MGFTVAVFAAAWFGIQLTRESGRIASIWFPNAVVVVVLLRAPRRRWPELILCGLLGNLGANLATGDASGLAALLSLCNTLEIIIVGWLFGTLVKGAKPDLTRPGTLLAFMGAAGLAAPAVSGALAAAILHARAGFAFWGVYRTWFCADALGLLIGVPLFTGAAWRAFLAVVQLPSLPQEAAALLVLIPAATATILLREPSWIFLVSPLLLWAAFRLGFAGLAGAIFLAAAGGLAALHHRFHGGLAPDFRAELAFLQVFLFTEVLIFLPVASLVKGLRESEAQFRLLFDKAPTGMAIVETDTGRFLSVNARLGDILGVPIAELLQGGFQDFTHPGSLEQDEASAPGTSMRTGWRCGWRIRAPAWPRTCWPRPWTPSSRPRAWARARGWGSPSCTPRCRPTRGS
jgi:integral membrane sensor domain MASE1